ncbi:hypothetical protein NC653_004694 [Populus alba x Populus x berolinensis]|uniref:PRA1 family protein n=1 Tax=Populus alba x Populus x berolinensis TaxID=444605 RepID=A0AAD6RVV0_9ROSI|nr:hypothetical protein NC653_004694 [Populus alba x Populus x berolinensis]
MSQPPPPSTTTTYITIHISAEDVISRSLQNFTSSFSILYPWLELFTSRSFTQPDSFTTVLTRLRTNFHHFRVNYSIIIYACGALSLIGSPFSLIIFSFVLSLWLFDTTKRLMSSPKCRSVEVINNLVRPRSNHREVNCINYKQQQQQQQQ